MIPADILRLAQEAGLIAKGVDHNYQIPVQIGRFAELVEKHAAAALSAALEQAKGALPRINLSYDNTPATTKEQ